jgi:hypothetical protein
MSEINDPEKWRISKSGYTIRKGWDIDKEFIAAYPYKALELDGNPEKFQQWIEDAELIVKAVNNHHKLVELVKIMLDEHELTEWVDIRDKAKLVLSNMEEE